MAGELLAYIDQQLRAGYSASAIKDYLIHSGYDQHDIELAFRQLGDRYNQPQNEHVEKSFLPTFIILCIGLFCLVTMFTIFVMIRRESEDPVRSISQEPIVEEVDERIFEEPVDDVRVEPIQVDDVFEAPAIEDSAIGVVSEESFSEKIVSILEDAPNDLESARASCVALGQDVYSDECFYQVTDVVNNTVFCGYIVNDVKHDRCLLQYGMKVNDFVCAQYKTDLRETCEELADG